MKKEELMYLLDYILEHKEIPIDDNELFNRDLLIRIRKIYTGEIRDKFELTDEQRNLIINTFKNSNEIIKMSTPSFIWKDIDCLKLSICRNINCIDGFVFGNTLIKIKDFIINEAKKQGYILGVNSPKFLKSNYDVALNSIHLDCQSADYIDYELVRQIDTLIDEIGKSKYVLNKDTPGLLKQNRKIVFNSIKNDINSAKYVPSFRSDPEIFSYLLLNNYAFSEKEYNEMKLNIFLNPNIMNNCFINLNIYNSDFGLRYINHFNQLFNDSITKLPTIKTFQSVFKFVALEEWQDFRNRNIDSYKNIFGKICAQLRNSKNFKSTIEDLLFLDDMQEELGEKYNILYSAMKEYFDIAHSSDNNKIKKIQSSKDTIAKLSALFISKTKENFIKNEEEKNYNWLKKFFRLKTENPMIREEIVKISKKNTYAVLYWNKDKDVISFINSIKEKYSKIFSSDEFDELMRGFVVANNSKMEKIIKPPAKYNLFVRYEKSIKLINRLNSGYIKYDGPEMNRYKDIIKYDQEKEKYYYTGSYFSEQKLNKFKIYREKIKVFEQIKRIVNFEIEKINIENYANDRIVNELTEKYPFTDEYFVFDEKNLDYFSMGTLCNNVISEYNIESFTNEELYLNVYDLLISKGIIWLLIFMSKEQNISLKGKNITKEHITEIINDIKKITTLANVLNFDLSSFGEYELVNTLKNSADIETLSILGEKVIEKLCKDKEFTNKNEKDIVEISKELIAQMSKRNKSTVPYISGSLLNYKYSMYDAMDETILLSGIYTNSCFKANGNVNDFFHYCALDKNGFIIKITDSFNNFIARAAGFRSGNSIFINQLRTIYDAVGNNYDGSYDNEKKDILDVFKMACDDIVTISQNNVDEINKIDFVFVTKSYVLKDIMSNVSQSVSSKIGKFPIDIESDDWIDFISNTDNVESEEYFETDYGNYELICVSKSNKRLISENIEFGDVEAKYKRVRNKIIVTSNPDNVIIKKINRIKAIRFYLEKLDFELVEIPKNSVTVVGDNWYFIYMGGGVINSCPPIDEESEREFNEIMNLLFNEAELDKNYYIDSEIKEKVKKLKA